MKNKKKTRPKPTPPKRIREAKPDWELIETLDWEADCKARERKRKGSSKEVRKLLNKMPP